jgi:amphi-Trp domain-containing protein
MPEELLFENERKLSRTEAARYFRSLANKLVDGGELTISAGDRSVTIDPPDLRTFEVKVERETERNSDRPELSLELELEWPAGNTAEGGNLTVG